MHHELLVQVAPCYRAARHGERSAILDEFIAVTGYDRKYAIRVLLGPIQPPAPIRRPRRAYYGREVQEALASAWLAANGICATCRRLLRPSSRPPAIASLGPPASRTAWVKDDLLAKAFGPERVFAAATIFGAQRSENGTITVTSPGATYLGELDGPVSERVQQVATAFSAAGIPTQARADIASVLWSKACNAAGVFGEAVLTRVSKQRLFADPHLMRAYLTLVRETAAVAAAYGVQVGNYPSFPPNRSFVDRDDDATIAQLQPASTGTSYASMTQDLLDGRPLEGDAVFGDLVERAERIGCVIVAPHADHDAIDRSLRLDFDPGVLAARCIAAVHPLGQRRCGFHAGPRLDRKQLADGRLGSHGRRRR